MKSIDFFPAICNPPQPKPVCACGPRQAPGKGRSRPRVGPHAQAGFLASAPFRRLAAPLVAFRGALFALRAAGTGFGSALSGPVRAPSRPAGARSEATLGNTQAFRPLRSRGAHGTAPCHAAEKASRSLFVLTAPPFSDPAPPASRRARPFSVRPGAAQ